MLPILFGVGVIGLLMAAMSSSADAQPPVQGEDGTSSPLPDAPSTPLPNNQAIALESQLETLPDGQRAGAEAALAASSHEDIPAMQVAAQSLQNTAPAVSSAIQDRISAVSTQPISASHQTSNESTLPAMSVSHDLPPTPAPNAAANAVNVVTDVIPPAPSANQPDPEIPAPVVVSPALLNLPPDAPAPVIEAAVDQQLGISNTQTVAPSADTNAEQARNLAPLVSNNIASRRFSYSRARVRDFQRLVGLNPDGIYGPMTRQALINAGVSTPPAALFR